MERLGCAGRHIANIRLGADHLLEALFIAGDAPPHSAQQHADRTARAVAQEEAAMHRHFDDLRAFGRIRKPRDNCYTKVSRAGRARSVVSNWEGRDQSPSYEEPTTSNSASVAPRGRLYSSMRAKVQNQKDQPMKVKGFHEEMLQAFQILLILLQCKACSMHLGVSLELLVKFVRTFGPVIHSTVSAGPSSVGVDLQAEQRRERCNLCFIELEKVKN